MILTQMCLLVFHVPFILLADVAAEIPHLLICGDAAVNTSCFSVGKHRNTAMHRCMMLSSENIL